MQRESQHVTNLQSPADGINTNFEHDTTGESFIGDILSTLNQVTPLGSLMLCKFIQQGMDVAETFQLDFK